MNHLLYKKVISFLLFIALVHCLFAQVPTHQYIGPASFTPAQDIPGLGNISWSIGEVVVFNELPQGSNMSIAQGMQSYTNPPLEVECANITLNPASLVLCNTVGFTGKLSFTATSLGTNLPLVPDSIQWYYSPTSATFDPTYSKLVGADSTVCTPYFPGYYAVRLKFNSLGCAQTSSTSSLVSLMSSAIVTPSISASGSPTRVLKANPGAGLGAPNLQWYVFLPSLGKYLMIAGASSSEVKVRYNGSYMVVASYPSGCRLSAVQLVSGHAKPIQRASDIRVEGNTVFIPEYERLEKATLAIYPNPASGSFYVEYRSISSSITRAALYSNTGVFMSEIEFSEGEDFSRVAAVNAEALPAGIYFLKVGDGIDQMVQKVVIYK